MAGEKSRGKAEAADGEAGKWIRRTRQLSCGDRVHWHRGRSTGLAQSHEDVREYWKVAAKLNGNIGRTDPRRGESMKKTAGRPSGNT